MKKHSVLRRITATLLSSTLCCSGMTVPAFSVDETEKLPARFDWREEAPEILTPVKKQVGGTCWAHATLGCIESNMIRKGMANNTIDLSESHLIWFTEGQDSPTDPDDLRYGGGRNLRKDAYDNGTKLFGIAASLAAWQGVVYEDEVPSHSQKPELDESLRYRSIAHLQNAESYDTNDVMNAKHQLMKKGPLFLSYFNDHNHPLSDKSGYYNPNYTWEKDNAGELDGNGHAVMIVGWDDNYPKESFNDSPPDDGAWILRNSYGDSYKNSDHGFFYMSYYEPSINTIGSFDCEPVSNYGSVHHYNCAQLSYRIPPSQTYGFYVANVFEAAKPEKLTAVGFFSENAAISYELFVYALNDDPANPQDGTLAAKTEGFSEFRGFHTVKLPQSIAVEKGQKYSVVLKLPIGAGTHFDTGCYKEGVSYYAYYSAKTADQEKRSWSDCYQKEMGDICLHVYTEYEGETVPTLPGDMDRNGRLTAADLSLMKQAIRQPERSDLYQPAADWNGDSEINAEDARGLLSFLLRGSDQDELKIRLTGSTADEHDEAFRRQMQDAAPDSVVIVYFSIAYIERKCKRIISGN